MKKLISCLMIAVIIVSCAVSAFAEDPVYNLGDRKLSVGMKGTDVAKAQERLTFYKYYTGTVDGIYGSGTFTAVKNFQANNKLTVDGKIGPNTAALLLTDTAVAGVLPSDLDYTLKPGSSGEAVKDLQRQLRETYYYEGKIDGIYGSDVIRAVKAFQASASLTADGKAGAKTKDALYNRKAAIFNGGIPPRALSAGDRGWDVYVLQKRLQDLNFLFMSPDGYFGADTAKAIKNFEAANGLKETGKYYSTVKRYLYPGAVDADEEAEHQKQGTADDPYQDPKLKLNSHGSEVANAQMRLKAAGYLLGNADGIFGPVTEKAVKAMQKDYGLKVDGIIGRRTWEILKTFNIDNATPVVIDDGKEAVSPIISKLKRGSRGPAVTKLQQALIQLGYLASGGDDGKFGPITADAVKSFQKAWGLYQDGVVGTKTQVALNEALGIQWNAD